MEVDEDIKEEEDLEELEPAYNLDTESLFSSSGPPLPSLVPPQWLVDLSC